MNTINDQAKFRGGVSTESNRPIRFAGSALGAMRHICAFFHSPDEEYQVLLPFIKDGFARGEKAFDFELRNWADAYLRDGHFDQNRMLALIQEVLEGGRQQGFPLTRLVAHMEWALEDRPGVDDLVEYETRLNYLLPGYKDPVI